MIFRNYLSITQTKQIVHLKLYFVNSYMNKAFHQFRQRINNSIYFKSFLLSKLPAAFFAGLAVKDFKEELAIVAVQQKWFNKNPFGSIYFAVLSMAAEMSTGILCMGYIYKHEPSISMLITEQRGLFHKKATGKILFHCTDGNKIAAAVEDAVKAGTATIVCYAKGFNRNNDLVAEFWVTWSFKLRTGKAIPFTTNV